MNLRIIAADELDSTLIEKWTSFLAGNVQYESPFFRPEFTHCVGAHRADTRILIVEVEREVVGFLPCQLIHPNKKIIPIADYLSDYHGPIRNSSQDVPPKVWLTCGARYFEFNHLPTCLSEFQSLAWWQTKSPIIDISFGYEQYQTQLAEIREASLFKKIQTAERKLGKKLGPLTFEFMSDATKDLNALLAGKSEQFIRTIGSQADIFARPWIRSLMEHLFSQRSSDFRGVLSTLRAGDTLIAAHFGICTQGTLHYWFPWYDTDYAEYSPGLSLLNYSIQEAAKHNIRRIDLGRGEQPYKLRFANDAFDLFEGGLSSPQLLATTKGRMLNVKRQLKNTQLAKNLKAMKKDLLAKF